MVVLFNNSKIDFKEKNYGNHIDLNSDKILQGFGEKMGSRRNVPQPITCQCYPYAEVIF